jgi:methionine aminotransferase
MANHSFVVCNFRTQKAVMSKLPHVGTTIFTTMSKMAMDHQAINLSQGFPNFPVDEKLTDILVETAKENAHQYVPMNGLPALLEGITTLTMENYQRKVNPATEILVTAGATQGIFTAIQALVKTGQEVVILDPAYDCYAPAVILAGGTPIHINMKLDFTPDWEKINETVNEKTAMIMVNNPHNPSGKILQEGDLIELEKLMEKHPQLLLLSDEVYEYITFEQKHISANTRNSLIDRTIVVSSFGKTFHITGWKIGYLIAPENLMIEIKKVHQFLVFCVNSVAQISLAKYLKEVDVQKLGAFYQTKRDYFQQLISGSRFELLPSEGSYFQTASYREISNQSDMDFVTEMVQKHGVAAIPFSAFYNDRRDEKIIRFCFAKDNETLEKAAEKLCKI